MLLTVEFPEVVAWVVVGVVAGIVDRAVVVVGVGVDGVVIVVVGGGRDELP